MSDLQYSVSALDTLGSDLASLADDLRNDGRLGDVDRDDVAVQRVADALADFADDWDDNREELANNVENVGSLASEAAATLSQADQDLAAKARELFEEEQR